MSEKTGNGHNVDLERLLEDIKVVVRDGQELLRAGMGTFKEKARFGAQKTQTFVKEKPYHTMGVAFGIGIVAGLLVAGLLRGEREEEEED